MVAAISSYYAIFILGWPLRHAIMPLTPRFHYASAIIERLGYCFHILMPY
jgi:hypothetical protein